jgi:hypothetical protein
MLVPHPFTHVTAAGENIRGSKWKRAASADGPQAKMARTSETLVAEGEHEASANGLKAKVVRKSREPKSPLSQGSPTRQESARIRGTSIRSSHVAVYKEKRPKICFLYLGNETSPLAQRIHPFSSPGDLSKHFLHRALSQ